MTPTRLPPPELIYPSDDGVMGDSNRHYKQVHLLVDLLQRHFAARADVFIGGNILLLWYDDNGRYERVAPDVLLAMGVAPSSEWDRHSYQVWKEGVPPTVIIEVAEGSTEWADADDRAETYMTIGVEEYYLFDPEAMPPLRRLQGYHRTAAGGHEALEGSLLSSPALGLQLRIVDGWLRFGDPTSGQLLPTNLELMQELTAAEAEIARLRAELDRLQEPT